MTTTARLQADIPEALHRTAKAAAAAEGRTLAEVVTDALDAYVWTRHPVLAGALIHRPGEDEN